MTGKIILTLMGASLFFVACSDTQPQVLKAPVKVKEHNSTMPKQYIVPPPPRKKIELKAVEDDNYSPEYMYPEDQYKKEKLTEKSEIKSDLLREEAGSAMSREDCIAMIGQEKFDKYTKMFGNESASIKRCTLLKSMQRD